MNILKWLFKAVLFLPIFFYTLFWIIYYGSSDILIETNILEKNEFPLIRFLKW